MKEWHERGILEIHVNTFDAYLGPEWAQASSLERLHHSRYSAKVLFQI
jgi:hypothetical protein